MVPVNILVLACGLGLTLCAIVGYTPPWMPPAIEWLGGIVVLCTAYLVAERRHG